MEMQNVEYENTCGSGRKSLVRNMEGLAPKTPISSPLFITPFAGGLLHHWLFNFFGFDVKKGANFGQ